ncbi:AAA family ATPase [Pseudactinotalea sp. HY160]|uniref:ATP-binding protein n=1 Tax=Pseudactinotalea sp. HY160 TaxID=2654490 RepID=UPI0013129E11|nr:AAA family ATPase [Pseudactinotalea sp. HY160]
MTERAAALLGALAEVEQRIRSLVAARRAVDPAPDDPYRGLYISEERVEQLLANARAVADPPAGRARIGHGPLARLAQACGLDGADLDLLMTALAPEVEPRFEQLFGYLNDDVTRRRVSAAVAFELCGLALTSGADRARITHGPLPTSGLLTLEEPDRPLASRALRVPERVVAHLLGDDTPDPDIAGLLAPLPPVAWGDPLPLARALEGGANPVYVREHGTGSGRLLAAGALERVGRGVLNVELPPWPDADRAREALRLLTREARLAGAGLVLGPVDRLLLAPGLLDELAADVPVCLIGSESWDPRWSRRLPLRIDAPETTLAERTALWAEQLGLEDPAGLELTSQFRLSPEQIHQAARTARAAAVADGATGIGVEHIRAGARAQNGTALERLARRVSPTVGWDELVLPEAALGGLREVALRARHRERVLSEWRMRPGGGRGHGVAALFAGDSGTGKTMSAEVLAGDLGLDLYVVDLATVVDKYIGETEKNLERIFTAADGVNAVLLFDEADSIFGKRSEVKDAHDRYANIESAYLLQRLETFDGLVLLATNLRANIDDAFTRRLDVVVDFPVPEPEQRELLWDVCLGRHLPRADDLDLRFCAQAFTLSGGAIRSAAITAAYYAADEGADAAVQMRHVVTAVQREYRKLGRLTLAEEFGDYWSLLG